MNFPLQKPFVGTFFPGQLELFRNAGFKYYYWNDRDCWWLDA